MIFGEGPIIKNIAGDLNKLFLQGTRAGQPINNVEGDAAADQATVQLMADRDPVIRDISTGLGWAGREVTVSGTGALQLVNSLGAPLKSWSADLAAYQEGGGDPSPVNFRRIYGTNKLNWFVEESYDQSAAPRAAVTLPQDVYNASVNERRIENRSGVKVLTGAEGYSWTSNPGSYGNVYYVLLSRIGITNIKIIPNSTLDTTALSLCSHFPPTISNYWSVEYKQNNRISFSISYDRYLGINFGEPIDVNQWLAEQYAAGTPFTLVYELATPETIPLTTPAIPTTSGDAEIWTTAENGIITNFSATYLQRE